MIDSPEAYISSQLSEDEILLWSGKPGGRFRFQAHDILFIPFGMIWSGIALFVTAKAIVEDVPFTFVLFGIPMVLMGFYLLFGRFLAESCIRRRTFYGVTSNRIIIARKLFPQQLRSLQWRMLTIVSNTSKPDGRGTIAFGSVNSEGLVVPFRFLPGGGFYSSPAFERIEDAKRVTGLFCRRREANSDVSDPKSSRYMPAIHRWHRFGARRFRLDDCGCAIGLQSG